MYSSTRLTASISILILLSPVLALLPSWKLQQSFRPTIYLTPKSLSKTQRRASVEEEQGSILPKPADVVNDIFPSALSIDLELKEHKPMGCTVEETMDSANDYVFVTKLVPGGFADQAGIQVGDVLVAMNGMFGELTIVLESGVDKM
jgi:hypothetical protein